MKNILIFSIFYSVFGNALAVGLMPVPNISDVSLNASVTYNATTDEYEYSYGISSASSNVGDINLIMLDIKSKEVANIPVRDFDLDKFRSPETFNEAVAKLNDIINLPHGYQFEPVGTRLPQNWNTILSANGFLFIEPQPWGFLLNGQLIQPDPISPGEVVNNIQVIGASPPTIKEVFIQPFWQYVPDVADETEVNPVEKKEAGRIQAEILVKKYTLGPEALSGESLLSRTEQDLSQMITLGWVNDVTITDQIFQLFNEADALIRDDFGTQAKVKFQQVIDLISSALPTQVRQEVKDLILINVKLIQADTPDDRYRPDYDMVVEPLSSTFEIGETVSFAPKIIDKNSDNIEIFGFFVYRLEVIEGPHVGTVVFSLGNGTLSYRGEKVGRDIVQIERIQGDDGFPLFTRKVEVIWTGGPDYLISFFSPPHLNFPVGRDTLFVADWTLNIGTTGSTQNTTTRYFISETPNIDPETSFVLHERTVPPLGVGDESQYDFVEIPWPQQFSPGVHYFAACTDANAEIAELNELNNCSFHTVEQVRYKVGVLGETNINSPPDCSNAEASPTSLWPPNHKFKKVEILGITDVDQDDVSISITSITQDEEVNGISSGNTSPDGKGIGTPYVHLRSERDGTGDGRVYEIHFTASDSAGNECSGSVNVTSVVHDQGGQSTLAIDSGQVFDSTIQY